MIDGRNRGAVKKLIEMSQFIETKAISELHWTGFLLIVVISSERNRLLFLLAGLRC